MRLQDKPFRARTIRKMARFLQYCERQLIMAALCVECDAELNLSERARIGQRIVCPSCGVQLEVISARPLEVDVAYDDGEEWDDLDGYSISDDQENDLDDYGRIDGAPGLDDELDDDWDDDSVEDGDDEFDELEEDL
jgi:lysine biosynthesis protein LysW